MDNLEIKETRIIDSLETLRVVSDPLRLELLEKIRLANRQGRLQTAKQLAAALSTTLHKLYYHLNLLDKHGLIRVAATNLVSGIVEKQYAVTAWQVEIAENLLEPGKAGNSLKPAALKLFDSSVDHTRRRLSSLLDAVGTDWEHPARLSGRRGLLTHETVVLTSEQAQDFSARLLALVEEFSSYEENPDEAGAFGFTLFTAMIPNLPDRTTGENQENDQ